MQNDWTKEKPTKEGWYWYLSPHLPDRSLLLAMIVWESRDKRLYASYHPEGPDGGHMPLEIMLNGLWKKLEEPELPLNMMNVK